MQEINNNNKIEQLYCNKSYLKMVLSLSQNILLYKCNAFSILTKHLSHTVATTFAVWDTTAKLAWISFSFFTISFFPPYWVDNFHLST